MPGLNKTGPEGKGAGTGKGRGLCKSEKRFTRDQAEDPNQRLGRRGINQGVGRGQGRGRGQR